MRRSRLISTLLALALGVGSWLYVHRDLPWHLWSGDAHEYAVMARQLADGEGFTTRIIFPAELSIGELRSHPATVRPPLWPLAISPFFALLGARPEVVHGLVLLCHLGTILAATALAARLGGSAYGWPTALAVATSSQLLVFIFDGASEPLFALLVTVAFLLLARGGPALAAGIVVGLAYLTRYHGLVLLPIALGALFLSEKRLRPLLCCAAGFIAVAAPWWVRNWVVLGDPFASLLNLNFTMSPDVNTFGGSLRYMLEPDLGSDAAADPVAKFGRQLPEILARWPLASANLVAWIGILLGCVRRDLAAWALAVAAAGTAVGSALALNMGRYFMPLLPAALAIGIACWARYGGRLRVPALILVLIAPLLPEFPRPMPDVAFLRAGIDAAREARRDGVSEPGPDESATRLGDCIGSDSVVVAGNAPTVAWATGAVAIARPTSDADFWRIVDEQPVTHVVLRRFPRRPADRDAPRFRPRPECGPTVYEREPAPDAS